jgi:hypothetical protein
MRPWPVSPLRSELLADRWRRDPRDARREDLLALEVSGIQVFRSLAEALRCGFQVYDKTAEGYLVRCRTANGWAMALVVVKSTPVL